ncbi:MAG: zinc ribbon domain-containing protein [Eubacteriales bacterium]
MKCPKCNTKIPKKADFCPECAHQITEEEKKSGGKNKKVLWWILGPVLGIILILAIFVFFVGFVSSSAELVAIDVSSENIDYDGAIPIEISVECYGMKKESFDIPVYLDGELVHTFAIDYEGTKMGEIEVINESTEVTADATTVAGVHTVAAGDLTDEFNVYTAPSFKFSSDADQYYYLTDFTFSVDCTVENTGETAGDCECVSLLNGASVDERTLEIAGKSTETFSVDVFAAEAGIHEFEFGGQTYEMPFYAAERGTTGKLMENTVKGYGYIDFDNLTATDMIVYVTRSDDSSTAVIARYIRAGEFHKINSIVHGEYDIFVQVGTDFIPSLNKFYTDRAVYYLGTIDLDTNVVNGSGTVYYYDIEMTQSQFEAWRTEVDFIPLIPDNM